MADTNNYGMTRDQWQRYQNEVYIKNQQGFPGASPEYFLWAEATNRGENPPRPAVGQAVYGTFEGTGGPSTQAAVTRDIDPEKTQGYKFNVQMSNSQKEDYLRAKAANKGLTEYQYRKAKGYDTQTISGSYAPVSTQHTTKVTAPTGSGDQKLAQQAKVTTNDKGTKPTTPTQGTTAKQSVAANQVKTSPTTTADKNSDAGKKATAAQTTKKSTPAAQQAKTTSTPKVVPVAAQKTATTPKKAETETKKVLSSQQQKIQKVQEAEAAKHPGQEYINGKWVDKVQKQGTTNQGNAKILAADQSKEELAKQYEQKKAGTYNPTPGTITDKTMYERAEAAKTELVKQEQLRKNYSEKIDKAGNVLLAITPDTSAGTGARNVVVTQSDKSGNLTAVSGSRTEYRSVIETLAAAQKKNEPTDNRTATEKRIDAAYEKHMKANAEMSTSKNPLVAGLAKVDMKLRPVIMEMGRAGVAGGKLGLGKELTEYEAENLQQLTGIGTEKTYSARTNDIVKALENAQLTVNKAITGVSKAGQSARNTIDRYIDLDSPQVAGILKSAEISYNDNLGRMYSGGNIAASRALNQDTPIGVNTGSLGADIVLSGTAQFSKNAYESIRHLPRSAGEVAVTATKAPTYIAEALKEAEYLSKNPRAILPTAAFTVGGMVTGLPKSAYDDPAKLAIELATQEAALRGILKTAEITGKSAGTASGAIDASTKVVKFGKVTDQIPLRTKGALTTKLMSGGRVSGTRGTARTILDKGVFPNVPKAQGEVIGGLWSKEGKLLAGQPIASKKSVFYTMDTEKVGVVGDYFLKKTGAPKIKTSIQKTEGVQTVKLPARMRQAVEKSITEKGEFIDHYKTWENLAQKLADKTGEPVAIPTPKTAKGFWQQENEMSVIFPKNVINKKGIAQFNSKSIAGVTKEGYPIVKTSFGKMEKVPSVLKNIQKNVEYNYALKADKYGVYNVNDQLAATLTAIQRDNELAGKTLHFPESFEHGMHGKTHTESVIKNLKMLEETYKKGTDAEYLETMGKYHDITKIGGNDLPFGGPHAVSGARAIRSGKLPGLKGKNAEYLGKLSDDIAAHTKIKPFNSKNIGAGTRTSVITRPSTEAKMLANADRMDFIRFGDRVDKSKMFDLSETGIKAKIEKMLSDAEKRITGSDFAKDTRGELGPRRQMKTNTKIQTKEEERKLERKTYIKDETKIKKELTESKYKSGVYTGIKRQTRHVSYATKETPQRTLVTAGNSKIYSLDTAAKQLEYTDKAYTDSINRALPPKAEQNKANDYNEYKKEADALTRNIDTISRDIKYPDQKPKNGDVYPYKPRDNGYTPPYNPKDGGKYSPGGPYTPSGGGGGPYNPSYPPSGGGGGNGNYPPGGDYPGGETPTNYEPPRKSGFKAKGYSGNNQRALPQRKPVIPSLKKKKKENQDYKKEAEALIKVKRYLANNVGTLIY